MMPDAVRDAPMTRFLMFKIAIRSEETDLAAECLNKVFDGSKKDPALLYACVLDAQTVGDKTHTLAALQLVLKQNNYAAPEGVHLPALLRCTIRLMVAQLENELAAGVDVEIAVDQLCKLFEGGKCSS